MANNNRDMMYLALGIVGVLAYYNQDFIKDKYQCVANCYSSGPAIKAGASTTTMGASGTAMTPISKFDGSVSDAQAQLAATASGLGVTYNGPTTAGVKGLDDPMAGNGNQLAAFSGDTDPNSTSAINNVVAPLTQQENAASLAWVAAQSQQQGASLLPTNVSAENAALLNSNNFLAANSSQPLMSRPVMRNDGSQSQDFFRRQILVAPDATIGGGFNGSVADPIIRAKNLC